MHTRVTLRPGAKGTKKLSEEFGTRLLCVRYRYDLKRQRRLKTVEIIVDETPWKPTSLDDSQSEKGRHTNGQVGIRISFTDTELRETIIESGGDWDPELKLWFLPKSIVKALGLEERIVRLLSYKDRR
jgi:hypothetical protein